MISNNLITRIGLFLGPFLFLIVIFLPIPQLNELSIESKVVLAATLWMAVWWITETVPIYVTALLPLIIFPSLSVTSFTETSFNYADSIIFLFLGGFLLAKAVEKSNLHKRFAFKMLNLFGTNPKYIVAAFMVVTWFLGAWMSNTATAILMLPIALAVISLIKNVEKHSKFVVCLLLSVAYSASIGGVTTLIGTPPNAIFASLANSIAGVDVTFSQWLLLGLPIGGISLFVAWLYMIRFGSKITDINSDIIGDKNVIRKKLGDLGRISRDEKLVAIVFILTAAAWITRGLIWKDVLPMVDDSMIAIASAILLFLIPSTSSSSSTSPDKENLKDSKLEHTPNNMRDLSLNGNQDSNSNSNSNNVNSNTSSRLLDWNTAVTIPWGVLILIGGGLALANGFTSTGLGDWIAGQLSFLGDANYIIIILVLVTLAILPTEMISNTATAALLLPISASLATSMGINPILFMAPVAIATSYGFIMPVGTPPNAIVYSSGYVSIAKMARAGIPLDFISIVMVTILTTILVPLVF
jgi:solute carrier family 13 (sodium-dependent dicarboxylate transporter), member 2/3/5